MAKTFRGTQLVGLNTVLSNYETDETIKADNIKTMKAADYSERVISGNEIASDEEYNKAEARIQEIANNILGGDSNE